MKLAHPASATAALANLAAFVVTEYAAGLKLALLARKTAAMQRCAFIYWIRIIYWIRAFH